MLRSERCCCCYAASTQQGPLAPPWQATTGMASGCFGWVPTPGALVAALVYELVFREPPKKEVPGYPPLLHVIHSVNLNG